MKRENPSIEICPGITRRTVANGKTMYQMIATLAAGSRMPEHRHAQEQIVHILEGQMRLVVDGEDVLHPHQFRHDALKHLAFCFKAMDLISAALKQRPAAPRQLHRLAEFEPVEIRDDDLRAVQIG